MTILTFKLRKQHDTKPYSTIFKKSFDCLSVFIGGVFLVTPQVVLSAAIETAEFTIDPFPLQPTESTTLFLDITETSSCPDIRSVFVNDSLIDSVNKIIKVSLHISQFSGGVGCPAPDEFQVKVIDSLPLSEEYQVFVYREQFNSTSFFDNQKLIGSFNLTVAPNVTSSIPTLSEWMLFLIALILLYVATRKIQRMGNQNV